MPKYWKSTEDVGEYHYKITCRSEDDERNPPDDNQPITDKNDSARSYMARILFTLCLVHECIRTGMHHSCYRQLTAKFGGMGIPTSLVTTSQAMAHYRLSPELPNPRREPLGILA